MSASTVNVVSTTGLSLVPPLNRALQAVRATATTSASTAYVIRRVGLGRGRSIGGNLPASFGFGRRVLRRAIPSRKSGRYARDSARYSRAERVVASPSSSGLGLRPFKAAARVRIPLGIPRSTAADQVKRRFTRRCSLLALVPGTQRGR